MSSISYKQSKGMVQFVVFLQDNANTEMVGTRQSEDSSAPFVEIEFFETCPVRQ